MFIKEERSSMGIHKSDINYNEKEEFTVQHQIKSVNFFVADC